MELKSGLKIFVLFVFYVSLQIATKMWLFVKKMLQFCIFTESVVFIAKQGKHIVATCFSFENNCLCSVTLPVCRIGLILIHRYVVIHRLINSKIIFAQLHKFHKTDLFI